MFLSVIYTTRLNGKWATRPRYARHAPQTLAKMGGYVPLTPNKITKYAPDTDIINVPEKKPFLHRHNSNQSDRELTLEYIYLTSLLVYAHTYELWLKHFCDLMSHD